jgi:hypothetical protein
MACKCKYRNEFCGPIKVIKLIAALWFSVSSQRRSSREIFISSYEDQPPPPLPLLISQVSSRLFAYTIPFRFKRGYIHRMCLVSNIVKKKRLWNLSLYLGRKGKIFPVQAMNANEKVEIKGPLILNFRIRWKWALQLAVYF